MMTTMKRLALLIALAVITVAGMTGASSAASRSSASAAITAAIASPDRPQTDRAQDERRKPEEFLTFAGIAPGMRVLDAFAAGGYYTELLARVVGSDGTVIAYNNPAYARFAAKGIATRYAGDRLPNVQRLTLDVDRLDLPPGSLDAVIFVMSYHDLYWRPADGSWTPTDPLQLLRELHGALKPGGVVIVQDHVALPGADPSEVVDKLHRIDPAVVRRDFAAAGFEFEIESHMLAHAQDDHTKLVFDPAIRGQTDQFVFRFRRP